MGATRFLVPSCLNGNLKKLPNVLINSHIPRLLVHIFCWGSRAPTIWISKCPKHFFFFFFLGGGVHKGPIGFSGAWGSYLQAPREPCIHWLGVRSGRLMFINKNISLPPRFEEGWIIPFVQMQRWSNFYQLPPSQCFNFVIETVWKGLQWSDGQTFHGVIVFIPLSIS